MTTVLVLAATAAIIFSFTYTLGMYLEGRTGATPDGSAPTDLLWVYLIPCLNEERVIGATLDALLAPAKCTQAPDNCLVVVVDDGSSDSTAEMVRARRHPQVVLLQRHLPEARQGKGAALNAALAALESQPAIRRRSSDDVIVCLLDADGRLDPHALDTAGQQLADPRVGGVQVAVRIRNRADGLLTRLQDMEFVCYTELFQRCRSLHGFAGLGGNGQFTRLSALRSLGRAPWAPSVLTEDLDLGVRLVTAGWRVVYTPEAAVSQQGLASVRALVRQRSRWFQGLLQCWQLIPRVVARAHGRQRLDLLHMLLTPVLIFAAFLMTLSFVVAPIEWLTTGSLPEELGLRVLAGCYLLTFVPALLFALVYRRVCDVGRVRSLVLGHVFVLYGLLWVAAGLRALARLTTGRHGWLKTSRVREQPAVAGPPPLGRRVLLDDLPAEHEADREHYLPSRAAR